MTTIYLILFFIYGLIFGSFFNVVGSRLPKGESIILPPSHCNNCGHKLTAFELIPVLSYIFQKGKCKKCGIKLSVMYPIYELFCGIIFATIYYKFGITKDIIIPLTFISMLLIIIVSDIEYMIIPDEILIFFGIILLIEISIINGVNSLFYSILYGIGAFGIMLVIKLLGDFLFKKESMGGGDIKLMFFFGLCTNLSNALFSIFIGSVIGLPISLIILKIKKTNIIPFGPFLSLGIMIIILTGFDINVLLNYIN